MKNTVRIVGAASAVALATALAACAPTATTETDATTGSSNSMVGEVAYYESAQEVVDAYDISELCGDQDLTIAWASPLNVTWLQTVEAILRQQLEACPNVTLIATDAQGDPQKANSDINSLVAQGVDGIITDPIFGETQIPAMRAAFEAGVGVATMVDSAGAVVGEDITVNAPVYQPYNGQLWAEWLNEALDGEGTYVFIGGAPGQPSSLGNLAGLKSAAEEFPGLTLLEDEMQPANNDAAEMRQLVAGLLAKHGRIDAIITDNGTISAPVIDAYEAAGYAPPALGVSAGSNGLFCAWEDRQNFPLFSTDGNHMGSVVALRLLLASINGINHSEPNLVAAWPAVNTLGGQEPLCDPDASPDADWSTSLSPDEMIALFG